MLHIITSIGAALFFIYFIYPFICAYAKIENIWKPLDLDLEPWLWILVRSLNSLLIWTNYFIYWLAHSTNFFQEPAAHEKLIASWIYTWTSTALLQVAPVEKRERKRLNTMTYVIMLICHCCTTCRKIAITFLCFHINRETKFFLHNTNSTKVSNILLFYSANLHWQISQCPAMSTAGHPSYGCPHCLACSVFPQLLPWS